MLGNDVACQAPDSSGLALWHSKSLLRPGPNWRSPKIPEGPVMSGLDSRPMIWWTSDSLGLMAIEHSRLLIHNPPPVWMVKPLNVIYSWWLTYRQESTNSLYITSYIYIYTHYFCSIHQLPPPAPAARNAPLWPSSKAPVPSTLAHGRGANGHLRQTDVPFGTSKWISNSSSRTCIAKRLLSIWGPL